MDDLGMANRRFSLGARGYNQDEVDAYLAGIAERMTGPDANPAREASRISIATFSVVTLGYSRSEVNRYLSELRETLERRAERRPAGAIAVADEPVVEVVETAAPEEPAEVAEPTVEAQLHQPEAEADEADLDEPAETEVPADVVSAAGNGPASAIYRARVTPAVSADAVAESDDAMRQSVIEALHEIRAALDALESLVARDLPAEEAGQEPVAEPAVAIEPNGNGHEPAPGLVNFTRDIIRMAREGMVTRR
jgi:DivIVA domain-containing protein